MSYDGNGRVLTDGNGEYIWDVEGHLIQMVNAWQKSYDPDGKVVWDSSGAYHVYGPGREGTGDVHSELGQQRHADGGDGEEVGLLQREDHRRGAGQTGVDASGGMDVA